jgi:hypothetical protein
VLAVLTLPPGVGVLWLWHGWKAEQRELAAMGAVPNQTKPLYPWLPKVLPGPWWFMAERVSWLIALSPPIALGPVAAEQPLAADR